MTFSPGVQKDFLKTVVQKKLAQVARARQHSSLQSVRDRALGAGPPRNFIRIFSSGFACIAEVKKRSPSRGLLSEDFDPRKIARQYEQGGASAISVLTDGEFFGGGLEDLTKVKENVSLPVLRKDFIIDEYQIHEARAYGADAILLISEILSEGDVQGFVELAGKLGMAAIVESHKAEGIEKAKSAGAQIIGVNNRDLNNFTLDLETSFRMRPLIPDGVVAISESGIKSSGDLQRLRDAGYRGALIGETLMLAENREQALRKLLEPLETG
ncbi:MAG: indole-3-glycerol phosphate synthase TrpC [Bacteroidota bacterium]